MSLIGRMALSTALVAVAAGSLGAQSTPPQSAGPTFKITARTVIEDVVVLDKNGRAVPGLRRRDFQIYENGKRQAITFFDSNFAASAAKIASAPALPPDTFTNVAAAPPSGVTNVLLLDALDTRPTERMYAHCGLHTRQREIPHDLGLQP